MKKPTTKRSKDKFEIIMVEPFGMKMVFYYGHRFAGIDKYLDTALKKWVKSKLGESIEEYYNETTLTSGIVLSSKEDRPVIFYTRDRDIYTIIHEVNHVVEKCAKYFCFEDEVEFKAYLQESLTRIIWGLVRLK